MREKEYVVIDRVPYVEDMGKIIEQIKKEQDEKAIELQEAMMEQLMSRPACPGRDLVWPEP